MIRQPLLKTKELRLAKIHAAELVTYNADRLKEAGLPFVKEASMYKFYVSQVADQAAKLSIERLGEGSDGRNVLSQLQDWIDL